MAQPHFQIITMLYKFKQQKQTKNEKKQPPVKGQQLQKGGVPAAPSGTATLLRLSPSY